jgi:zinc and cadmium transporter
VPREIGEFAILYIAMADLIAGLHRQRSAAASVRQFILMIAGIGTLALFFLR